MNDSEIRERQEELNKLGVEEYSWMDGILGKDSETGEIDLSSVIENGRITEGAYAQNHSIEAIDIPEGVTDIGEVAFYGCAHLRRVGLPESLRIIREEAFGECGLESVYIPEGVERIVEKAFFCCEDLARIDIPGENIIIEEDAFSGCDKLLEGFVARGYPQRYNQPEELLFTLLWCTCPERHKEETGDHAKRFISENEQLIIERILKFNNVPAMNGISKLKLLKQENINKYVSQAHEAGRTEIVALLLAAIDKNSSEGEFEL